MALISFRKEGLYCPQADVYIDPSRKVKNALITHAHSDHAKRGHENYLCTERCAPVLRHRLGQKIKCQTLPYGERININGVDISFHPAGHIIGSAQIRLEYKGEIWVVSGDYKVEHDGFCQGFEPVQCTHFVSECTFGLPIFNWRPQEEIFADINQWWQNNRSIGRASVLSAYSLGKAQRLLQSVDHSIGPVYTHPTISKHNQAIENSGIALRPYESLDRVKSCDNAPLIITPTTSDQTLFGPYAGFSIASASGWMAMRGARKRRSIDRGFVLSDHADWKGINQTIKDTGAEHVYVTHGYTKPIAKWLNEQGIYTKIVESNFERSDQTEDE